MRVKRREPEYEAFYWDGSVEGAEPIREYVRGRGGETELRQFDTFNELVLKWGVPIVLHLDRWVVFTEYDHHVLDQDAFDRAFKIEKDGDPVAEDVG